MIVIDYIYYSDNCVFIYYSDNKTISFRLVLLYLANIFYLWLVFYYYQWLRKGLKNFDLIQNI